MMAAVGLPASAGAAARPAGTQIELDRILSRVGGRIVTQSDVRQARDLRLVEDTSSDEAVRRALEDRWLILNEIGRAPVASPSDEDVAARRNLWEARGGRPDGGMDDTAVQAWLRDDLRISAFLDRQFGSLPEAERGRARDEWLARLRARADLD
jgi:hypothetical protein